MPAARDVSGSLPSGEVSAAGLEKERKVAGDLKHGKISSSYPPVFRAKPGESFKNGSAQLASGLVARLVACLLN